MEVLRFKYLHAPIHFEGMQRIETLEIPDKAFREILYNAIAHKLYSGAAIQMHVYDDRIEVWNDGSLPAGYTPETLMRRHSSKPRNKNIAFAFFKAGFIDRWGLGYRKIMDGFKEAGMEPPTIELVDGGVRVTIWRRNVTNNSVNVTNNGVNVTNNVTNNDENVTNNLIDLSSVSLTERQRNIIDLIKNNRRISAAEMSRILSVTLRTIKRDLKEMQRLGVITRDGKTKATEWIVNNEI